MASNEKTTVYEVQRKRFRKSKVVSLDGLLAMYLDVNGDIVYSYSNEDTLRIRPDNSAQLVIPECISFWGGWAPWVNRIGSRFGIYTGMTHTKVSTGRTYYLRTKAGEIITAGVLEGRYVLPQSGYDYHGSWEIASWSTPVVRKVDPKRRNEVLKKAREQLNIHIATSRLLGKHQCDYENVRYGHPERFAEMNYDEFLQMNYRHRGNVDAEEARKTLELGLERNKVAIYERYNVYIPTASTGA